VACLNHHSTSVIVSQMDFHVHSQVHSFCSMLVHGNTFHSCGTPSVPRVSLLLFEQFVVARDTLTRLSLCLSGAHSRTFPFSFLDDPAHTHGSSFFMLTPVHSHGVFFGDPVHSHGSFFLCQLFAVCFTSRSLDCSLVHCR